MHLFSVHTENVCRHGLSGLASNPMRGQGSSYGYGYFADDMCFVEGKARTVAQASDSQSIMSYFWEYRYYFLGYMLLSLSLMLQCLITY